MYTIFMARCDMIGLAVEDIQASMNFYRLLGVDIPESWEGPYAESELDGGIRLSWNAISMIKEMDPEFQTPVGQGISLAFKCETPEDVDRLFARVVGAGYSAKKDPRDAFWGQRYCQVVDPDGYVVDLFSPLP